MFTKSELQSILAALQPDPAAAKVVPVKSGGGVVSRAYVVHQLQDVIETSKERISIPSLSQTLSIDATYITGILPTLTQDEWALNGREVVPKQTFAILENDLRSRLKEGAVAVVKYCREHDVQIEFLRRLVGYIEREWDFEVHWIGERYIFSRAFLKNVAEGVLTKLRDAEGPTEVEEAMEGQFPTEFKQRVANRVMGSECDGVWQGSVFVPTVYKVKKQEEVREALRTKGWVEGRALKRAFAEVEDVGEEVVQLREHWVTRRWLEGVEGSMRKDLDERGWAGTKDLAADLSTEEQVHIQDSFRKKQTKRLPEHGGYLVTRELLDELLRISLAHAKDEAERGWSAEKGRAASSSMPWRSVSTFLETDHESLPQSLRDSIAQSLMPKVSSAYAGRVGELRAAAETAAKEHFAERIYARFAIHAEGVRNVRDGVLQERLAVDLLAYYHRIIVDGLTRLADRLDSDVDAAAVTIRGIFESDAKPVARLQDIQTELRDLLRDIKYDLPDDTVIIRAKTKEMQRELQLQLERATEVPLMLLAVLILLFSAHEGGILRATGKYAPKLLKLLKGKIAEEEYAFLNTVKGAVIAGTPLSPADVARLRGAVTAITTV